MFDYNCPHCEEELKGSFGDNVYCKKCNKSYETDWDYTSYDSAGAWLTGVEYEGKINIEEDES